jgi:hypothetical protein
MWFWGGRTLFSWMWVCDPAGFCSDCLHFTETPLFPEVLSARRIIDLYVNYPRLRRGLPASVRELWGSSDLFVADYRQTHGSLSTGHFVIGIGA